MLTVSYAHTQKDKIFDAVVLPGGGKGAENLASSSEVGKILQRHEEQCKILAAVCAAPTAFLSHGVGKGKNITSYPAFKVLCKEIFQHF